MIISNSNNFAVTRAQKTGGTSLELYILGSGLANGDQDLYVLEGDFASWEEFKEYSDANQNLKYENLPRSLWGQDSLEEAQVTFEGLVNKGLIVHDMPCIGSIRNPIEWLSSLYYYANLRRKLSAVESLKKHGKYLQKDLNNASKIAEPNDSFDYLFDEIWELDEVQKSLKPQCSYYPDHAQLFNIENIHEHVSEFITSKGGIVPNKVEARKSDNDPSYYLANLSEDRKKRALDIYAKDFELWEKAYAVYN